ncbi:hypothetical protein GJ688_11535 [Heliobacillus mobilis]|uniref:Uncharacterized protein n=1 Tax=Heliobacterium mobile TaxID=28064 RepID=A0A6I3SL17_HELMO|nr:hypothetical protein [Heliobacterium mobile]MTV49609.1 hypothetical protein [Heliobacterium mobile]
MKTAQIQEQNQHIGEELDLAKYGVAIRATADQTIRSSALEINIAEEPMRILNPTLLKPFLLFH